MNAITVDLLYHILEAEMCRGNGDMPIWLELETTSRKSWVGPAVVVWLGNSSERGQMIFLRSRRELMTQEKINHG